ncbi:MAG: adenylate/guanylate cyclase domain-containing protein [Actinomycetota bacterium]
MTGEHIGRFDAPDEVVELELLRSELVSLGGMTISRTVYQPGWRWSVHVRPHVGGEWCLTRHVGVSLSGRVHVVLQSGSELDIAPGMVLDIPPGHDAWVVGDEPFIDLTWTGARTWLPLTDVGTERVTATILFTDIVDSTALAQSLGYRGWADLISTHDERVSDTLNRFGGRVVKTTGDGVLAIFNGTARALQCAMTLREIAGGLGIRLRAAIHTGEIDLAGTDIRGVAVHEASRILGLSGPNRILVSATVRDLLADSGFSLNDLGEFELRGLPGRRRLYEVE